MARDQIQILKSPTKLLSSLFLFPFLFVFSACFGIEAREVLKVCSGCDYKTLSSALLGAKPDDQIEVQAGTYREGRIVIEKPISLIGIDFPVIEAVNEAQPFTIRKTSGVKIEGFQIQNTGMSYIEEIAGIKIIQSERVEIINNRILNSTYGVYLDNSKNCVVSGNQILGKAKSESSSGNGVHIWYGSQHKIEKNLVQGHRDGIYLEFTDGTQILGNQVSKNLRYGLHFMQSNETGYEDNIFSKNGSGVAVMYSKKIHMTRNRFENNGGPAAYGLLMKEVSDSEISQNRFSDNTIGIFMEGSNRSKLHENVISGNGWALKIMGDCEGNDFFKNDFVSNTYDVATNADHSWNQFRDNFWSKYDGYDLNHDGVGDAPYRPVSLSASITEGIDSSFVLINSFLFSILDRVERALPTLIPATLLDESPRMIANQMGAR